MAFKLTDHWLATTITIAVTYLSSVVIHAVWKSRRPKDYPPGPKPLPIIGNVHQIPPRNQFLQYTSWRKEYGDIVGIKVGGNNFVILNSAKVVNALLEKRGDLYSGRTMPGVMKEVMGYGPHIAMCQNGEYLRTWRASARLMLRPSALKELLPMHSAAAAYCVQNIIEDPEGLFAYLKNWALTTPLKAVVGINVANQSAEWMEWYFKLAQEWFNILEPGSVPPLDIFPIFHHVPKCLAEWKRKAQWVYHNRETLFHWTSEVAKADHEQQSTKGKGYEYLLLRILREQEGSNKGLTDEQLGHFGGGLLEASVGTTLGAFKCWLKILSAHPHEIKRIQDELDTVCGTNTSPQGEHLDRLPYLKASLMEAWRWRAPTPVSLPHKLTEDDTIDGFHIPKGSTIIQNNWSILRDPEYFDSPDLFKPERYFNNPPGTKKGIDPGPYSRPTHFIFGAGRRICPGDGFSTQSVLILMAKLLWASDIIPDGPVDVTPTGFHGETVCDPQPWKIRCVARDPTGAKAAKLDCDISKHLVM